MSASIPATIPELADAVVGLLDEHGPQTEDELLDLLDADGVDPGSEPEQTLSDLLWSTEVPLVLPLVDGRWALLPELLDGRVFTHRLTPVEAEHDFLVVNPDLAAVMLLLDDADGEGQPCLADGIPVREVFGGLDDAELTDRGVDADVVPTGGALLLPAGHLVTAGFAAGDQVGVRVTADGLALQRVADEEMTAGAAAVTALGQAAPSGADEPAQLDTVVWTACADRPELFRSAVAPLADLLTDANLDTSGDLVAPAGFDFTSWRLEQQVDLLRSRYPLDEEQAMATLGVLGLYRRVAAVFAAAVDRLSDQAEQQPDGDETVQEAASAVLSGADSPEPGSLVAAPSVQAALGQLRAPEVAEAVLGEIDTEDGEPAAMGLFAETMEPQAPRPAWQSLRWLRGKAHERLGDLAAAEAAYEQAHSMDPTWRLAAVDLARFASDRGDAGRGLALLRRAGAPPEHPLVALLAGFESRPRKDLGRNQRCWCGSGRKYKHCHLRRETHSLTERASWLYGKAEAFLHDGAMPDDALEAAYARAQYADSPDAVVEAVCWPLVNDLALFEGGGLAAFVAARGELLPVDERSLAEQWLLVDRSVYEVSDVQPGESVTVRDLRTGEVTEVTEHTASQQLRSGDVVCAHVLPAGEQAQFFGGIEPVRPGEPEPLMALLDDSPDPAQIAEFLSRRFAPPQLHTTEGEPIVLCEASLTTGDPDRLTSALDTAYDRQPSSDPDRTEWVEHVNTHGTPHIRATLRLDGDQLDVQTNSEPRLDRVLATLADLDTTNTVLSQSRRPIDDVQEAMSRREPDPDEDDQPTLDPADPQVAAALAGFVHDYEQRWLDDSIPALAGLTPKQAAADPTRREDLIRLLDSFPDTDDPGTMSPARLRAELGLEPGDTVR